MGECVGHVRLHEGCPECEIERLSAELKERKESEGGLVDQINCIADERDELAEARQEIADRAFRMKKVLRLILDADALAPHAYENDPSPSIIDSIHEALGEAP